MFNLLIQYKAVYFNIDTFSASLAHRLRCIRADGAVTVPFMANQSQSLFRLIHSLTPSEKRYFTISAAAQHDSTAFLKVFKCINGHQTNDAVQLKHSLRDEPFLKHVAVIKVQLYHFLLKVLRNYHESRSVDFRLKEMMMDAAILNEKALYHESRATLHRARKLAKQYEDWKVLLEILHKEYTLAPLIAEPGKIGKELHRINADEKKFIRQLNNYGELAYIALSLSMLLKRYQYSKKISGNATVRKVMRHPLLRQENAAVSFRAKSLFHHIWSSYFLAACQFEKAEHHLTQQIHAYEQHRHFMKAAPGNYLGALNGLLLTRYRQGKYEQVTELIHQLKKLTDSNEIKRVTSKRFRMVIFSWTFKAEIGAAIKKGQVHEQLHAIQEQEPFFYRHFDMMEPHHRLETLLALATFHFHLYDRKKAAELAERLLRQKAAAIHHELNAVARVLQIVLHYEDGNFDVLEYLVSGLKRFVARQKEASMFELKLPEFSGKLLTLYGKKNQQHFFEDQLKEFSVLKSDRFEKHQFDYFDLTAWLKKKVKLND